jgi:subtilisin family serine protease
MSDAVRALGYAVKRGARVVNASWGGQQCSRSLRESIRTLEGQNVFFVTAAGNAIYRKPANNIELVPEYPASLNLFSMLTVGAVDLAGTTAEFSNFGPTAVHLFAPGENITSTLPGNQMGPLNGTSMATPFVAGAVALLLSAEPAATVPQVRQALYSSASTRADYVNASKGRLNLRGTLGILRQLMAH